MTGEAAPSPPDCVTTMLTLSTFMPAGMLIQPESKVVLVALNATCAPEVVHAAAEKTLAGSVVEYFKTRIAPAAEAVAMRRTTRRHCVYNVRSTLVAWRTEVAR